MRFQIYTCEFKLTQGFNRLPYGVKRTAFDVPEYNDRQVKPEIWEEDSKCLRNVDDFDKTENRYVETFKRDV